MVSAAFNDPGDVFLYRSYVNSIPMGTYFTYELNPDFNNETMPFLRELKIHLLSLRGDADLFASLTEQAPTALNAEYHSRKSRPYDEIVIVPIDGEDVFNSPIYFSVFARTYVQYEVSFEYTFIPDYDILLENAIELSEGNPLFEVLDNEYDERLYSFVPWWGGRENRTAVFLADVIHHKVFFYSKWNEYPKHLKTSWQDQNDTIAVYGSHEDTRQNGTWYIRLRPEFTMADLFSDLQYIYNMYAFSMAPASTKE
jgi:hypothetical protein